VFAKDLSLETWNGPYRLQTSIIVEIAKLDLSLVGNEIANQLQHLKENI
jgi:hypothetical protein